MRITNEVIQSYIECKYKSYLLLTGTEETSSEYENFMKELLSAYRTDVTQKYFIGNQPDLAKQKHILTELNIKKLPDFLFNSTIKSDPYEIHYDVLKKIEQKSSTSRVLYSPLYLVLDDTIREKHKLYVAVIGFLLGKVQKEEPDRGIIIHGKNQKSRYVKLHKYRSSVRQIIHNITQIMKGDLKPPFFLCNHCKACRFQENCFKEAIKKDDLSLIRGVTQKEAKKLNAKGIFSVNQLSYTFRPRRKRKNNPYKKRLFTPALKALAIREQKIHVHGLPQTHNNSPIEIFFDIEGLPTESFYYLIGIIIINGKDVEEHQFWANNKEDEIIIFNQFFEILNRYQDFTLFHYGSYETKALKYIKKKIADKYKKIADKVLDSCSNLLSFLSSNIYLPTYSNGLKEVGSFLGHTWGIPESSGLMSIIWRKKWELTSENSYKTKLLVYNRDDCYGALKVKKLLDRITDKKASNKNKNIIHIDTLPKSSLFKFMTKEFALPEIETIRDFAYFDYQMEKVHARTNQTVKRQILKKEKRRKIKYRPNKKVHIASRLCIRCKSKNLKKTKPLSKMVFDLRFFDHGVKRWVTQYESYYYECTKCGHVFNPRRYRKVRLKYGHSLMSWVIFQNIVNKESVRQIAFNLHELFQLNIPKTGIHEFKNHFAKYYKSTLDQIKMGILNSNVIYVDETPLLMKHETGYAWVFTNLQNVISIYKTSREGEFLKKILKDFEGILVSDFYPAYDSINCIHQKCLIHLIRDFNDDLLKFPFDEEFKYMTKFFTLILKEIVKTIDRYGLKQKNLNKHKKSVEIFFGYLETQGFTSETAIKFQTRLLKNKGKLFQFLNFDDVSWNNSNAEHAIKLLATHTNKNIKFYHSTHMEIYLNIISIYQTCKYRNISFLDFLLSGETDIEKFSENKFYKRKQL